MQEGAEPGGVVVASACRQVEARKQELQKLGLGERPKSSRPNPFPTYAGWRSCTRSCRSWAWARGLRICYRARGQGSAPATP